MWGTQTPKKGLMHCDKGVAILNPAQPDSHEVKVYDEPYVGRKGVFNSVAYITMTRTYSRRRGSGVRGEGKSPVLRHMQL
jgi:hypothetical protein